MIFCRYPSLNTAIQEDVYKRQGQQQAQAGEVVAGDVNDFWIHGMGWELCFRQGSGRA